MDSGIGSAEFEFQFLFSVGRVVRSGGGGFDSIDFLDEVLVFNSKVVQGSLIINSCEVSLEILSFDIEDSSLEEVGFGFTFTGEAEKSAPIVS